MAIGDRSDLQVFHTEVNRTLVERIATNTTLFNEGSAGSLQMDSRALLGTFERLSFFDTGAGATFRDPTDTASEDDVEFTQDLESGVRCYGDFRRSMTESAMAEQGMSVQDYSGVFGTLLADAMTDQKLKAALTSVVTAIAEDATLVHDISGGSPSTLNYADVNVAIGKFTDASDRIVCGIVHGARRHVLPGSIFSTNTPYAAVGSMMIEGAREGAWGRRLIARDDAALTDSTDYRMALLVPGAVTITDVGMPRVLIDRVGGLGNISWRFQAEFEYFVRVRGHKYEEGTGGVAPNLTTLGTATSWTRTYTSTKNGPGVILQTT